MCRSTEQGICVCEKKPFLSPEKELRAEKQKGDDGGGNNLICAFYGINFNFIK